MLRAEILFFGTVLTMAVMLTASAAGSHNEIQSAIRNRLVHPVGASSQAIREALTHSNILIRIYSPIDYSPLWSSQAQAERFLALLAGADEEGLLAEDYHLSLLHKMQETSGRSAAATAEFDILLTDAFSRFAYNLRFGKLNPYEIDENWNFSRFLVTEDPAQWLRHAIVDKKIAKALDWLRPNMSHYRGLKVALRHFRTIASTQKWPVIPDGPSLKQGIDDPRVVLLRARLNSSSATPNTHPRASYFDDELGRRIKNFQRRYGLFEDGIVGPKTLAAMNLSPAAHIDQLRINLERLRWLFRDIEDDYIIVNIAAFQAAYIRHDTTMWRGRAVVGRPYRQTPSFKAKLEYIVFNPTWTVPPTILHKDVLPAIRKDDKYLQHQKMRVFSRSGNELSPATIDWKNLSEKDFPYSIRQDPGPHNALGRVKFIFPNPHFVYLHDTSAQALFQRAERSFSSGCIRIEGALELADILLDGDAQSSEAQSLVDARSQRRVDLKRDVEVMLVYLTAFTSEDRTVNFRRDIYQRDAAVLKGLNGPFRFVPPRGYQ